MSLPSHVPESLVLDFDFYRPGPVGGDPFEALNTLRQAPDIFWTPCNGGHWVAIRGQDIRAILLDHERFSSRSAFIPTMDRPRAVPLEIDPPEHAAFRRLLLPAFAPRAIAGWTDAARELAIELIEDLKARGELNIFIEEWLTRIPDFSIAPGRAPRLATGIVHAVLELPLIWPTGAGGDSPSPV